MAIIWNVAQSFLDGFTSMASIYSPAIRPGSEESLFLTDSAPEMNSFVDQTIMADVEHFLHEVEPLIIEDHIVYNESQILLKKVQRSRNTFSTSQSSM